MPNHVTNFLQFKGDKKLIEKMLFLIQNKDVGIGSLDFNKVIPSPESVNLTSGSLENDALNVYLSAVNPNNENFGYEKVSSEKYQEMLDAISSYTWFSTSITGTLTPEQATKKSLDYFNGYSFSNENITIDKGDLFVYGKILVENLIAYGCATWYDWNCKYWGTKWNAYDFAPYDTRTKTMCFSTAWSAPHPVIKKLAELYPDIKITHKWADEDWGNNTGVTYYNNPKKDNEPQYFKGCKALRFSAKILGIDTDSYYFKHNLCIDVMNDIPLSISKEEVDEWLKKGFDWSSFPKMKTKENEYDISDLDKEDLFLLLDELYRLKINITEFLYG